MFQLVSDYKPAGDQPQAIAKLTAGIISGAKHQTLLGVTGSGKTFTVANVIKNVDKPDARHFAQQNAGRAALRRVQKFFSAQRRRIFRQLLRLLPARGLHPAHRHVHRKGFQPQRGDRTAAALDHEFAVFAARRDCRRERLVHLRHRQQGRLRGDDHSDARRQHDFARTIFYRASLRCNTSATTSRSSAAIFACAATPSKSVPPDAKTACAWNFSAKRSNASRASSR